MNKRVSAFAIALTLAAGLTAPALAAEPDEIGRAHV